jgi:NAD(P)H-hydrate epimerase
MKKQPTMIVNHNYIRESERVTMATEPISSTDLMERAATTVTEQLLQDVRIAEAEQILVFCGPGNNGGDGLVVARLLARYNYPVTVVTTCYSSSTTPDFDLNYQRIQQMLPDYPNLQCVTFDEYRSQPTPAAAVVAIDALFGIGLSRPLTGQYAEVVDFINAQKYDVVAVDIPSGLFIDQHTPKEAHRIKAQRTYTFQWQKWAFLLPENAEYVGKVSVLDIGLRAVDDSFGRVGEYLTGNEVAQLLLPPRKFAHKGSNGHGLLIAGSQKMPGAAILSATAALRSGIGKVTVHTTPNVAAALPHSLPEAILDPDACETCVSVCHWEEMNGLNAIAIGPGIGQAPKTAALLKDLLSEVHTPTLFDADALNLLADNKTLLAYLPANSILTPHFKEFERLAGPSENDFDRIERVKNFSQKYNVIVILKGAHSVIATPDGKVFVNSTGNAGMATAGSGDVLTGLLLGLMARTQLPEVSAIVAAYLHGLAGDLALENESEESLIASDICHNIGKAFKKVRD